MFKSVVKKKKLPSPMTNVIVVNDFEGSLMLQKH